MTTVIRVGIVSTIAVWAVLSPATATTGDDYKMLESSEVNCQLRTGGRIERARTVC